jgi:hypothetical protein
MYLLCMNIKANEACKITRTCFSNLFTIVNRNWNIPFYSCFLYTNREIAEVATGVWINLWFHTKYIQIRFDVLMAVGVKITVFYVTMPYGSVDAWTNTYIHRLRFKVSMNITQRVVTISSDIARVEDNRWYTKWVHQNMWHNEWSEHNMLIKLSTNITQSVVRPSADTTLKGNISWYSKISWSERLT